MTDTQINAFLAVAYFGNFTKAANSLFISEPALSRSINLLEKEIGCTLIERKKGGRIQTLTTQGKHFLQIAERWKILLEESKELSNSNTSEVLRISATESFSNYLLPPVYDSYLTSRPASRLMIDTYHTQELHSQIIHNSCDIALVSYLSNSKHIESTELFREKIVIICPVGMFSKPEIHPSDLDASQEILSSWAPDYQAWGEFWFGSDLQTRIYLRTLSQVPHFILQYHMWTFMPVSVANYFASRYPIAVHNILNGPPDRICYALQNRLYYHTDSDLIISLIREEASKIEGITLSTS